MEPVSAVEFLLSAFSRLGSYRLLQNYMEGNDRWSWG